MILALPSSGGLVIRASDGTLDHFPARVSLYLVLVPCRDEWECVRVVEQN